MTAASINMDPSTGALQFPKKGDRKLKFKVRVQLLAENIRKA